MLHIEQLWNMRGGREVREAMPMPTIPPSPPTPRRDSALRLWVVLARAFDAVERHSRASIARFHLGTTEFGVLEVLYHKGTLPVCEVQRRILIESGSTTYVVDKLVRRGLGRPAASPRPRPRRPPPPTRRRPRPRDPDYSPPSPTRGRARGPAF